MDEKTLNLLREYAELFEQWKLLKAAYDKVAARLYSLDRQIADEVVLDKGRFLQTANDSEGNEYLLVKLPNPDQDGLRVFLEIKKPQSEEPQSKGRTKLSPKLRKILMDEVLSYEKEKEQRGQG